VPAVQHTDEMVRQVDSAMLTLGRMQPGELVTIVAGSPPSTTGSTNAMRVHRLGTKIPRLAEDDGVPRRRWNDPPTAP
jgi:pyruvate kinase